MHFVDLDEHEFVEEAVSIVERAKSRGVVLRVLGAAAVYIHSQHREDCISAFRSLGRFGYGAPMFTDLDLAGYAKQRKEIAKLLQEINFKPDMMVNAFFGDRRLIYYHPLNSYQVDIFLNKLAFSHEVHFGEKPGSGRLELDYPTISLTDLVLEKLQIHYMNRKDLVDLIVLFLGHDADSRPGKDMVDGSYIANMLSDDWGFWYDSMSNLGKVKYLLNDFAQQGKLSLEQVKIVTDRIEKLLRVIDSKPKTKGWQKRASVGTSKSWFQEVEEMRR